MRKKNNFVEPDTGWNMAQNTGWIGDKNGNEVDVNVKGNLLGMNLVDLAVGVGFIALGVCRLIASAFRYGAAANAGEELNVLDRLNLLDQEEESSREDESCSE